MTANSIDIKSGDNQSSTCRETLAERVRCSTSTPWPALARPDELDDGKVTLSGNSAIEFASGEITTIGYDGSLMVNGGDAFVEDAGALGSNSALTGLAVVDGFFALNSGATLKLTGGLTVAGTLDVDAYTNPTQSGVIGGTTLTINGGLVDTGTVAIGDAFLTADDTVTATSLAVSYGDYLYIAGTVGGKGSVLDITSSVASFDPSDELEGNVTLSGNATLEFASGGINSIYYGHR